jgi:hypothetical protein
VFVNNVVDRNREPGHSLNDRRNETTNLNGVRSDRPQNTRPFGPKLLPNSKGDLKAIHLIGRADQLPPKVRAGASHISREAAF